MKMTQKVLSLVLAVLLVCLSVPVAMGEGEATKPLAKKEITMYALTPATASPIELYFLHEDSDIPMISVSDVVEFLTASYGSAEKDGVRFSLTMETNGDEVLLRRENGSTLIIDFSTGLMTWSDRSSFAAGIDKVSSLDVLELENEENAWEREAFQRTGYSFYRPGGAFSVSLAEYGIPFVHQEDGYYLPVATVSDLFLANYSAHFVYNGKDLFFFSSLGELEELYYEVEPSLRSDELREFTYNEFCLFLQTYYGLQELHGIDDFRHFFAVTGLEEQLKSEDPIVAANAMNFFLLDYIDDMHTAIMALSPYAGMDQVDQIVPLSTANNRKSEQIYLTLQSQAEAYPEANQAYYEVGNTAYITFHAFCGDYQVDFYGADLYDPNTAESLNAVDMYNLVSYANAQIHRENSPIENVVLDLSRNGGGDVNTAIYLMSWMLGECTMAVEDPITHAQQTTSYRADVNRDHMFDEKDAVTDLKRFCLISPYSFSCGNLVPAILKASGEVTLLGRTSGGGACVVLPSVTADGTIFQMSDSRRIATVVNGSWYNVDTGVTPHFVVDKMNHYYDRKAMADYINQLH